MKRFLTLALVALSIMVLTACTTAPQGVDVQELIPADANLIAQIQDSLYLDLRD